MKTTTNKLWEKAIKLIPGGTQLYSKRPSRFLPDGWPTYYSKANGCYIWDLEGKKYLDMSYMGIGACVLGYADPDVDKAVKRAIDRGSMSTLNCPEEVELASTLTKLHPWADMVRFGKTGADAMAIAVRIARAYTGRDKVAYCGYHGWNDWYLAGGTIESKGVPKALDGTAIPFKYGELPPQDDYAAIIMEVEREHEPDDQYLRDIRMMANDWDSVLIFDEITSGFRETYGGLHLEYGINPDLCALGKAMGNGYPISAVIGRREIMKAAEDSFISSTFWTERIGTTAAIATIDKFREEGVIYHLCALGEKLRLNFKNFGLETNGILPLIGFKLGDDIEQTIFNREMLKRGILATNNVYLSYAHTDKEIDKYLMAMGKILQDMPKLKKKFRGKTITQGFKRLT